MKSAIWLVGSGLMAQAYASVLKSLNIQFEVIGRGEQSAIDFEKATGIPVHIGGIAEASKRLDPPDQAIVAVNIEELTRSANTLVELGCKHILLEKPGSLNFNDLVRLHNNAKANSSSIYIAYNRRFYSSVDKLRDLCAFDGGITSAFFEFTEWSHPMMIIITLSK